MKKKYSMSKIIKNLFVLVSVFTLAITFLVENPTQKILAEENTDDRLTTIVGNDLPVHDPSIIKDGDTYYVFGTHGAAAKSTDMRTWENIVKDNEVGNHTLFGDIRQTFEEVFKWSGNPQITNMDGIGLWAPDVYYNDKFINEDGTLGAYLMYFSVSTGQDVVGVEHYRSLIGLASSKNIEGPYGFEDVVVYSGFLNTEGKSHYDNTDFNKVFPDAQPRTGYFNNDRFNFDHFPNAIDPTIVDGKDGTLHMSYGSWNGGIWVLDLDASTGLPVRPDDYAGGKAPGMDDSYFGTRISGGFKTSGEGSYVQYHEPSGFYHLYVTYGGLTQNEHYNIRFFRSENIEGPYVDSQGNNPKFSEKTGNDKYGDRLLGSFEFLEEQTFEENASFYSYRVPGHNSVLYGDDENDYIVFHTRFKDKGEGHAVRVHQLIFDKDGWPLISPSRYEGEEIQKNVDLDGQYALVDQERDNSKQSKLSKPFSFNKDGSITGSYNGTWETSEGIVKVVLGTDEYEGYALNQGTSLTNYKTDITLTLRGVSDKVKGNSIIGVRLTNLSSNDILTNALDALDIDNKNNVINDINLPKKFMGVDIVWESNLPEIITSDGKVNRLEENQTVTLTANLSYEGLSAIKSIKVTVLGLSEKTYYHYKFNGSINEDNMGLKDTHLVGNRMHLEGGVENYSQGIVKNDQGLPGEAFRFDGETGIELPRNIIKSENYSVSMWMNPEQLTHFTSLFFGATSPSSWVSFAPVTGHDGIQDTALLWSGEQWYMGETKVSLPLNKWSHIAFTNESGVLKVYIDGLEVFYGEGFPNIFGTELDNFFGLGVNYWDIAFKGSIDDLLIYPDSVLSSNEIKVYYDDVMMVRSPEDIAKDILGSIQLPEVTEKDIELVKLIDGFDITWSSSNSSIISTTGKVTQPEIGQADATIRLIAFVTVDGETFEKEFLVVVRAKKAVVSSTEFSFDRTLKSNNKGQEGSLVGNFINAPGGNLNYAKGIVNDGVYLDGSTGILLPRNLITSNKYSISLWLNPEQLTGFTTAFFGEGAPRSWISIVPQSGNLDHNGSAMLWSGEQWYDGLLNKNIPINSWSHIAVEVNQGSIEVYLNGLLAHKGDSFPDVFGNHNDNVFALGVNFWDIPFKGTIDELKVLPNGNMGSKQIKEYYDSIMSTLSPEDILNQYLDSLVFGVNGVVTENVKLPAQSPNKVKLSWSTSNAKFISSKGVVTRPTASQGDQKVRLTVSATLDGKTITKYYDLIVKALPIVVDTVKYTFDGHLEEQSKNTLLTGKTTGQFIDKVGNRAKYSEGKVGQGVYLDGSSGIRLPDNLITGNVYSVSMWLKPETLSPFSTTFFGLKNADSWLSFTPKGVADQAVLWSGTQWYDGLTGDQFNENQWRHVAFTVDNGNVKVYVDGLEKHNGTNFPKIFDSGSDQIFGLGVNYWDAPFKGTIDELKIETKRVMSSKEIFKDYDETVGSDRFIRHTNRSLRYNFDGNIGNASITGDKIDNGGGSVSYQEGVVGEAVYLNGSSGLRLPDNFLSSDTYSLQMWVKPENVTPFTSMFFGGTSNSSWVNLPASGIDGKTMFWSGEQWYDAITPESIPANRWSHLAVSVDKGNVNVFIDGEVKFSGTGFPDIFNSKNTFAGIGVNFWDLPFKGLIDEFEIDNNVARSANSIKEYYGTTKPEQEEFERNQEKNHYFKFEDNLIDELDETLEGIVIGDKIGIEGGNEEYVAGKEGQAVYLDGNTGILLPNELITSESYSVSLWINPEELTAHTTTFFGSQNEGSWLSVIPQSGDFTEGNSMVWSGTQWYDGNLGTQIEVDKWSHIAFSVDNGIINAYLDGQKVFVGEAFPDIFTQEGSVFSLGVNYWDIPFVGALDELMIFDSRVLSDEEVEAIAGGEFDIDKDVEEDKEDVKDISKTNGVPVITYIGVGAIGIGALIFFIKRFLDAKKVV